MAIWTKNNRACTSLWTTLFSMQQLRTNFDDSGELKMNDLTFYNSLGSTELRQQQAMIVADQLDNVFRIGRGAKYELGAGRTSSISAMVSILTDENKLVADLAEVVDSNYKLWGE